MKPTGARLLIALAVAAGGVAWAAAALVFAWKQHIITVGWGTAISLATVAAGVGIWGLLARPRLRRDTGVEPLAPFVAARTAALALACSRTAAISGGAYAGLLVGALSHLPASTARADVWTCSATVLASAALVAVALWLESLCHIKGDGNGRDGGNAPVEPAGA